MGHEHDPASPPATLEDAAKRKTLSRITVAACAGLGCAVAAGPVGVAFSPLFKDHDADGSTAWSTLGPASRYAVGAPPARVVLRADAQDSWIQQRGLAVGAVLVRRLSEDVAAAGAFEVFSSVCPHLGCAVRYEGGEKRFFCPCHGSAFELDGSLVPQKSDGSANPSPRSLDTLEHRVETATGLLQIRWARYRTGSADKVEIV
ncbi:MAG: menaquinol-cytochrome c reductase iron-sulfur subunit [Myxococcota bacterium]|jgi:menaquinol-cytochrome c reductase iron-sulfur subunit